MTGEKTWEVEIAIVPIIPGVDYTPPPITSVNGPAQPVVKMPIAGPAPFNTLAVARGRGLIGSGPISDDTLHRTTWRSMTHLKIPGIDHDRPLSEQLVHSSTASILAISSGDQVGIEYDSGSNFQIAIDVVHAEAYVDETTGRFGVDFDTASLHNQTSSSDFFEMTTWVMYFDPDTVPLDEAADPIEPHPGVEIHEGDVGTSFGG